MQYVRCRTGSLEMIYDQECVLSIVRCRTGSLEIGVIICNLVVAVRCRTGSLEKAENLVPKVKKSSLPHRQLRKLIRLIES